MIINSELPIKMLGTEYDLNEYEFVLFHLYKTNKKYKKYFKDLRKSDPERLMIFDNSAYEFFIKGETLDMDEYVKAIRELKPQMYILPDVLMDEKKTIKGTFEFLEKYGDQIPKGCQPLAVIQGKTEEEIMDCYKKFYEKGLTRMAVPFHNSFFKEIGEQPDNPIWIESEFYERYYNISDDVKYGIGRACFMWKYREEFRKLDYVHILGSHCPVEKLFYIKDWDSMDTGYPVKLGYMGIKLLHEDGKPNVLIDDMLNFDPVKDESKAKLIRNNVMIFKNLV